MEFGANKTPIKVIKESGFVGTYFRGIYSSVNGKWYRKSWCNLIVCKNLFLFMLIFFWVAVMKSFFEGAIILIF